MAQKRMTQQRWNAVFTALSWGIDQMEDALLNDSETDKTEWRHAREAFIILWDKYGNKSTEDTH